MPPGPPQREAGSARCWSSAALGHCHPGRRFGEGRPDAMMSQVDPALRSSCARGGSKGVVPLAESGTGTVSSATSAEVPTTDSGGTRRRLTPGEKRSLIGMFAFITLLHVLGWGTLIGVVAPQHYAIGDAGVLGIAVGLVAYTLGMRHAFDADHIAAIDNTTRKLMAEQQRPMSVGFWFSLGHSTVVLVMVMGIAL